MFALTSDTTTDSMHTGRICETMSAISSGSSPILLDLVSQVRHLFHSVTPTRRAASLMVRFSAMTRPLALSMIVHLA